MDFLRNNLQGPKRYFNILFKGQRSPNEDFSKMSSQRKKVSRTKNYISRFFSNIKDSKHGCFKNVFLENNFQELNIYFKTVFKNKDTGGGCFKDFQRETSKDQKDISSYFSRTKDPKPGCFNNVFLENNFQRPSIYIKTVFKNKDLGGESLKDFKE